MPLLGVPPTGSPGVSQKSEVEGTGSPASYGPPSTLKPEI